MKFRRSVLLAEVVWATTACGHGTQAELAQLEQRYAGDAARIDDVAVDLSRLTVTQRQVLATYATAKRAWETAEDIYVEAGSQHELAARTLEQAAADFEAAEHNSKVAAMAMVTIAAGSIICNGTMSTREFRRDLARKGMPMDRLEDVDHIFPRSRGGIDHPLNYEPLERSLNRSLGNKMVATFMQAPIGFVRGMAVSALGVIGGCN